MVVIWTKKNKKLAKKVKNKIIKSKTDDKIAKLKSNLNIENVVSSKKLKFSMIVAVDFAYSSYY